MKLTQFFLKIVQRERESQHYTPLPDNSAKLQTAKQTVRTSKNLIEFTYSDFSCHPKVNRDKLALINCLWKCKKDKRLTITSNSFRKRDQLNEFHLL